MDGCPLANRTNSAIRKELVVQGQAPHTAIVGCADSRAPLETIFDTMPGAQLVNLAFNAFGCKRWNLYELKDLKVANPKVGGCSQGQVEPIETSTLCLV